MAIPAVDPTLAPVVIVIPSAGAPIGTGKRPWGIGFWIPLGFLVLVAAGALFAPWLNKVPLIRLQSIKKTSRPVGRTPSLHHWFGTDELGRDIFARLLWGGRVALTIGLVSVLVAMIVGGLLGLLAGYYRGPIELALNTVIGSLLAFPPLVLVIAIVAFLGHKLSSITLAIAIVAIPAFARIAYANTLAVSEREYVMAARSLGANDRRILSREIVPNVLLPLSAFALIVVAVAIVAEGGLAFLGLSLERPTATWGAMINDGRKLLTTQGVWHVSFIPAMAMFLTVLCLNLLGDKIRQRVDPRGANL